MLNHTRKICVIVCLGAILSLTNTSFGEVTDRHREVTDRVMKRLLAVMGKPAGWEVWPPEYEVTDPGFANAFAMYRTEDGIDIPRIEVTVTTIEEIAKFDEEALAFTLGHELGHLYHHHSHKKLKFLKQYGDDLNVVYMATQREFEYEADLFGMQLAFKAGYTRKGLMKDLQGWRGDSTPYCRYEGLKLSHPTWEDRAQYLFDDKQAKSLWRSLSSFQTGVLFLENQHYPHAEACFREVTTEFPDCYEAWANLGYALLMQYCDALDAEDIRSFDIGHLVVGGFYRRPDSLERPVRGVIDDLWFEAVGAFREALRLKERLQFKDPLLMVKANLAVAYLVHPAGKDVGQAERWFEQVFIALEDEELAKSLDPLVHASILINSGSARGFKPDLVVETLKILAQAKTVRGNGPAVVAMESALQFNQARTLLAENDPKKQQAALKLFEQYLDGMTSASSYWPIAYRDYVTMAKAVGVTPKAATDFRKPGVKNWRPITSVELPNGKVIGLSQSIKKLMEDLGPADVEIPVAQGTNLKYYKYNDLGITVLATREVLAVIFNDETAPGITVRRPGLGGDRAEVTLGMKKREIEQLFGDDWDSELVHLFDENNLYALYRDLGLAVLYEKGVATQLVVTVVPMNGGK
ncbi:M48 family metalloprotease [Thalassoglobus polymorphus]|uniref:Peptidase family M48 n=1 Tax=Thalassoglobus polymorphus TaxID=2527994 RepID=A0A517QMX9_9PLAN|nr:M48 family metalloprotease [Thalassoglobus polymorphus]QDT32944.1 Peptidase family M48 [Thalassoglobus polymorphus]